MKNNTAPAINADGSDVQVSAALEKIMPAELAVRSKANISARLDGGASPSRTTE